MYDPGNTQSNIIILNFLDKYLTQANFKLQNAKPIFQIEEEKTTDRELNYFDFVLVGLIGMALMNSSVQGVSITMAKYRDDKILKRITTTPLPAWQFIISEVLARLILNIAITIPMMFLAGVFFPIDQLPDWLSKIVQYLPLAPFLRMLREIGLESISPLTNPINIIIVISWIAVMLVIASYRFRLTEE